MKGLKYDSEKPRWELLPLDTIEEIVKVMTYGAKKYAPNNWKKVRPKSRYFAAALRHMTAYQSGEIIDKESGLPHLTHALCSLMFLQWINTHK
ncbi:MAG: dATP/dGTP diphosphohydrolase domain-containing protein [Veillonellales bacterium]